MGRRLGGLAALLVLWGGSAATWALPGDWTSYTSVSGINDVCIVGAHVWAATSGGLLRYGLIDSTYRQYTSADGLTGNQVLSVQEDGLGGVWAGTDGQGLSKFVVQTGAFLPPFTEFRDHQIHALCYDRANLFVGTESGISVFLPDKEPEPEIKETYHQLGRLPKDTAVHFIAVYDDTLWAGTERGIAWAWLGSANLMDPESWHSVTYPSDVRSIIKVDTTMFAGSGYGTYRRRGVRTWVSVDPGYHFTYDLAYYDGSLYAATKEALYRSRGGEDWDELLGARIRCLSETQAFGLWMGTDDGLRAFKGDEFVSVPRPSGPAWDTFTDIAIDETSGNIWLATSRIGNLNDNGVHVFDGQEWTHISSALRAYRAHAAAVTAAEVDAHGKGWVGTWGGSLHVFDQGGWCGVLDDTTSVLRDSDPAVTLYAYVVANALTRDPKGNMWVSNYGRGVAVFDDYPQTHEAFYGFEEYNPSGTDFRAVAICVDSTDVKWIGTYDAGLFLLDDGGSPFELGDEHTLSFQTSSHDELTSDKIEAVAVDKSNVLWVGTDNGLNAIQGAYDRASATFDIEDWQTYSTLQGLPSNMIQAICIDAQNNKWIATEEGLARIDAYGALAEAYTTANSPIVDDNVLSAAFNRRTGELWIGTLRGLSRYETHFAENPSQTYRIRVYPHPFVLDGGEATFEGLPAGASLEIFNVAGELVRALLPDQIAQRGPVWNGTNDSGYYVGSGIYFYLVTTAEGQTLQPGKIAVVNAVPR